MANSTHHFLQFNFTFIIVLFHFNFKFSALRKTTKERRKRIQIKQMQNKVFLHSRKADQPFKRSRIFSLCRFLAARFILVFLLLVQLLLFSEIFDIKKLYNYRELPSYDVLKSN